VFCFLIVLVRLSVTVQVTDWKHSSPDCRICNRKVTGSNLSLGYFAPRSTQPSITPGSVNEYQLRLWRQRQVWLIPIPDERVGVQVKLWNPSRTRAIPERFYGGDSLRGGAISKCTFTLPSPKWCVDGNVNLYSLTHLTVGANLHLYRVHIL